MDPVKLEKIQAIIKYKKHQLLLNNLFLYSLIALTCSLFCSSPFWYPSLCSSMKLLLFVSLPKLGSLFFSSKFLFILGNLIVVVLVRESKIFASEDSSMASDVYYDEYVNTSRSLRKCYDVEDEKERKLDESFEGREDLDGEEELNEELNKRADDFIARVNKQRRLEAN